MSFVFLSRMCMSWSSVFWIFIGKAGNKGEITIMNIDTKRQLTILNQCDSGVVELYHNYATAYGLSDTAFWLIYIIWFVGENCTQSEVCDMWFYKRQSINSALKRLEAQGYLTLESVHGNRKSKHIVLTSTGRELADRVVVPLVSAEIDVLEAFSNQERSTFVELTQRRVSLLRKNILGIMPGSKG